MENPTRVPMAMVEAVRAAAEMEGVTGEQLSTLVKEYWIPTQNWNVFEYLAGSMTVLEKIGEPNMDSMEGIGAPNAYHEDVAFAKKVRLLILTGKPIPAAPKEDEEEQIGDEGVADPAQGG